MSDFPHLQSADEDSAFLLHIEEMINLNWEDSGPDGVRLSSNCVCAAPPSQLGPDGERVPLESEYRPSEGVDQDVYCRI